MKLHVDAALATTVPSLQGNVKEEQAWGKEMTRFIAFAKNIYQFLELMVLNNVELFRARKTDYKQ